MINKMYKNLFIGALHKQRGDHNNIHYWRSLLWISLASALYLTTIAHWVFAKQYIAFSKVTGDGLFSIKSYNGSLLTIFVLTIIMLVIFLKSFPGIVEDFKATDMRRKKFLYRIYLYLYHLPSFVVCAYSYMYFLGLNLWG